MVTLDAKQDRLFFAEILERDRHVGEIAIAFAVFGRLDSERRDFHVLRIVKRIAIQSSDFTFC